VNGVSRNDAFGRGTFDAKAQRGRATTKESIWKSGNQEREPRAFLEFLISKLIPWLRLSALAFAVLSPDFVAF